MKNLPWHTKLVLALALFAPLYFIIAALGTKVGVWDWKFGLGVLTIGGGPLVLGALGLAGFVSLIAGFIKKPRAKGVIAIALIALFAVGLVFGKLAGVRATAAANPIHDIATDTANPPAFSQSTLDARAATGANPLSDYQAPLGQLELYKERASKELAVKSHAQIITGMDGRPAPLPLGGTSRENAVAAVAAAMAEMGLSEIRKDAAAGTVEGVATTFWFGFKDDVVARVGDSQIDFRSVSRVGISDLGANTARIKDLRARTEALLGTAAR
ncbi:MAG: DUF1499 domain-containing protein [Porphyrobacter sp.]|nr:DUF1499 domain-containing protein [Porphyrobacter sp.]